MDEERIKKIEQDLKDLHDKFDNINKSAQENSSGKIYEHSRDAILAKGTTERADFLV